MLSAHQPCYLPWLGFFDKVRRSDVFVLLDDVQFSTGPDNYCNRVKVKSMAGAKWLTVPVSMHGHLDKSIAEVETVPGWKRIHIEALRQYYKDAPYKHLIDSLVPPESRILADVAGMSVFNVLLAVMPEAVPAIRTQSQLGVTGHKTELIVNLCKATNQRAFLFGGKGKDYADLDMLRDNGIEPVFHEYHHPSYPQQWGGWIPGLSIVDTILNVGVAETRRLLCL